MNALEVFGVERASGAVLYHEVVVVPGFACQQPAFRLSRTVAPQERDECCWERHNLSPLLELDGYYRLVHLLDRPNLRRRSLALLYREFPAALRHPSRLRGHTLEVVYGISSLVFVGFLGAYAVVTYQLGVDPFVRNFVSPEVSRLLGWVLAAFLVAFTIAGAIGDMQSAARRGAPDPLRQL
jgi:hypothetical protein